MARFHERVGKHLRWYDQALRRLGQRGALADDRKTLEVTQRVRDALHSLSTHMHAAQCDGMGFVNDRPKG
jgi:hypothetical protein